MKTLYRLLVVLSAVLFVFGCESSEKDTLTEGDIKEMMDEEREMMKEQKSIKEGFKEYTNENDSSNTLDHTISDEDLTELTQSLKDHPAHPWLNVEGALALRMLLKSIDTPIYDKCISFDERVESDFCSETFSNVSKHATLTRNIEITPSEYSNPDFHLAAKSYINRYNERIAYLEDNSQTQKAKDLESRAVELLDSLLF